ncbi:cyclic-AMP phosphodiesterase [Coniophora puteana RWD-64-598 SS2]|uniref:Cyclic-AMP phosphodiesterase n=1 Tax=Coniophora puteana (strain RWD-64-598) TaxID=741705 RepID=A0A5M3N1V5_CONPW|nr:cyclic-AMP phosphodiesterase [Coniophora puteana RWD-64-598 SS2]EIW85358.1 cyclic-AMP phosphodiesterase [Coniophora puteana RWD-64-598 SS2]
MPAFDIIVVGSGGGLDETNLSGYLLKPGDAEWTDGIIALEAGSGHGALRSILKASPGIFGEQPQTDPPGPCMTNPFQIYSLVRCFLITHAHIDHIASLVVSAGTIGGGSKRIYASPQTLKDLETVFADRVWPNLATWDESNPLFRLVYHSIHADRKYKVIFPNVSVRNMPVSHGKNESGPYESTAFFIRHEPSEHEFIFFGDVEPDSVASKPRNIDIWRAAAPKIPHNLSAIFIECSYPKGRPSDVLYGHFSPEHLVNELVALATEVVIARRTPKGSGRSRPRKKQKNNDPVPADELRGVLDGLRVYIMHCKEHFNTDVPIAHYIRDQVRELLEPHGLGVELLSADQGSKIGKPSSTALPRPSSSAVFPIFPSSSMHSGSFLS